MPELMTSWCRQYYTSLCSNGGANAAFIGLARADDLYRMYIKCLYKFKSGFTTSKHGTKTLQTQAGTYGCFIRGGANAHPIFVYLSIYFFCYWVEKGQIKNSGVSKSGGKGIGSNPTSPPLLTRLLRKLKFLISRSLRNVISQATVMNTLHLQYTFPIS